MESRTSRIFRSALLIALAAVAVLGLGASLVAGENGWTDWAWAPKPLRHEFIAYRAKLDGDTLKIEVTHKDGYHSYAFDNQDRAALRGNDFAQKPTNISVSGGLQLDGNWAASPEAEEFQGTYKDNWGWHGVAVFSARVKRTSGDTAAIAIVGQVCDETGCNEVKVAIALNLAAGAANSQTNGGTIAAPPVDSTAQQAKPAGPGKGVTGMLVEDKGAWVMRPFSKKDGGTSATEDAGGGLMALILACIGGGLLGLLMPCVFPMIPVTASYFMKQNEKGGNSSAISGIAYGVGMVLSFTALGLLLTAILGKNGVNAFGGSPWVAGGLAVLFLLFALSMFGLYEIRLPYAVAQKFNLQGKSSGLGGAFLLGTTFAVTSMACTVPIVGSLLAVAASGGGWLNPIVGMATFSATMAAPFVIMAALPKLLKKLPKAGGWMNTVKIVFGFVELAAAAEFLGWGRIISREAVIAIWIACAGLSALYLIGVFRGKHDAPVQGVGGLAMFFAAVFMGAALWLATGLGGNRTLGYLESFLFVDREDVVKNPDDLKVLLEQAKKDKVPVFLDLTGTNCTNCNYFEVQVLSTAHGKEQLKDFMTVQLYSDSKHGPSYIDFFDKMFGSVSQPQYAVINAQGEITAYESDVFYYLKPGGSEMLPEGKKRFEEFVATAKSPGEPFDFAAGFKAPAK